MCYLAAGENWRSAGFQSFFVNPLGASTSSKEAKPGGEEE